MNTTRQAFLSVLLLLVCITTPTSAADKPNPSDTPLRTLRFATLAPKGSSYERLITGVLDQLERSSGGRLDTLIYTGGVQGDEPEMVAKMRAGDLDGAFITTLGAQEIATESSALEIPFLFDGLESVDRIHPWLRQELETRFSRKGFVLLALGDQAGFIQMYSKTPLATLADLLTRKVWAWQGNVVHREAYRALGIRPVELPVPEVTAALVSGRLDVVTTSALTCVALGWYQHIRYVFKLDYRYAPMYVVMTRSSLERLPPAEGERIRTAFREREPEIIRALRVDDERALVGLRRHGIEVVVPTPEVRAAFQDRMTGLPDRLVELGLFEKSFYTDLVHRLRESRAY